MKLTEYCAGGCSIAWPLRETICFGLSEAKCHSIWGRERLLLSVAVAHAGLIALTLLDRRKYEAVKEDLEAQEREILLWQSQAQAQAQAQLQPRPQRVSCDSASQLDSSMEKLAVWTQIWRWLAERIRALRGKTNGLGQCLNLWFSALPIECSMLPRSFRSPSVKQSLQDRTDIWRNVTI